MRLGHPHDLIGHTIGLLLEGIPRLIDRQLGLETAERAVAGKLVDSRRRNPRRRA
jgi:hypothetical protein